jgi:diacylglycerol kinase (ATP)
MTSPFRLSSRARSFVYAGRGVWLTLKTQHNAWIHAVATVVVVVTGIYLGINRVDWCAIALACAAVWIAESLNTALEYLADAISPERHPRIGDAKDVAAGAVLISVVAAIIVGLIVFGPYVGEILRSR